MQLEDFPREVFIETDLSIPAASIGALREGRARTDRTLVVEIQDHGRVSLDGKQQVVETPRRVWANCLVLHQAGDRRQGLLVGRDRKVVAPEVDETLMERQVRRGRVTVACGGLVDVVAARPATILFHGVFIVAACLALCLAQRLGLDQNRRRIGQPPQLSRCARRALELVKQPCLRPPDALEFSGLCAEAEAIGGDDCLDWIQTDSLHLNGHRSIKV